MTPAEVLKLAEKNGAKMVDFKFIDFLGIWQHTTMPIGKLEDGTFEDGFGFDGSSIRGWQPINASDMIFIPDPDSAVIDPFLDDADAVAHLRHRRPDHQAALPDATRARSPRRPRRTSSRPASATPRTSVPRPSSSSSTRSATPRARTAPSTWSTPSKGAGTADREEGPNLGYKPAHKGGYFPVPPTDTLTDLRTEMALTLEAVGIPVEVLHHEVATGGQCEMSMRFNSLKCDGRLDHVVQVHRQERRAEARQDGDVHAEAALRRQRLGHALPPVALEGREEPVRRRRVRRPVGHGAPLHRRHPQARAGALRVHQPDHEQLQAAGAGLRGAGQPGVLVAQPLGVGPHPDRQRLAEGQAPRVPLPRPDGQPVPRVRGDADGRPRRHPEQDRPGRAARQGHLRAVARGARRTCRKAPGSLDEALKALERDHEFLLKGDVFTPDVIETWIDYKRENEVDALRLRPHPYEFALYFDN